jgi:signal transduction histidine kinase
VRIDLNIRDEGVCIHGAAPELSRAILNLIENAVEATGRARGRVQIGLAGVENTALLTIEDEGPGFAAEVLERVFSPSYTTKVEDGFVRGLGLGLFITRMVISLHGGQIVLENRPEGGARVTVRLPLVLTNADSAPTAA